MRLNQLLPCAALLAIALACGFEPDWTIHVPDSLSGLVYSQCAAYNPATDKAYVGGTGNCVIVIDCATNRKVARIPTRSGCSAMFCSPVNGRIYCVGDLLTVIDGAREIVVKTLRVSRAALCYNSRNERLHAYAGYSSPVVIDTRTDSIVDTVNVGATSLCYNPHDDRVYCKADSPVQGRDYVTVLNGSDLSFVVNVPAKAGSGDLCYNPASNRVYCASWLLDTVTLIDGATNSVDTTWHMAARALCYNARNSKLYCGGEFGVSVVDAASGSVVVSFGEYKGVEAIYHDTRNNCVYSVGGGNVVVLDGATDRILRTYGVGRGSYALAGNTAQNKVYLANRNGTGIAVLDGNTVRSGSTGRLQVNSAPSGAAISMDSADTGATTPHLFARVAAGQCSLGLTREGYPGWDSTVMINRGQTTTVRATLKSPPDSLWATCASSHGEKCVSWTGPERAVRFNARPYSATHCISPRSVPCSISFRGSRGPSRGRTRAFASRYTVATDRLCSTSPPCWRPFPANPVRPSFTS